jgi:hypothetical protein
LEGNLSKLGLFVKISAVWKVVVGVYPWTTRGKQSEISDTSSTPDNADAVNAEGVG